MKEVTKANEFSLSNRILMRKYYKVDGAAIKKLNRRFTIFLLSSLFALEKVSPYSPPRRETAWEKPSISCKQL
jgi:hypothetical protein